MTTVNTSRSNDLFDKHVMNVIKKDSHGLDGFVESVMVNEKEIHGKENRHARAVTLAWLRYKPDVDSTEKAAKRGLSRIGFTDPELDAIYLESNSKSYAYSLFYNKGAEKAAIRLYDGLVRSMKGTGKEKRMKDATSFKFWIVGSYGAFDESYPTVTEARRYAMSLPLGRSTEYYSIVKSIDRPSTGVRQRKEFMGQVILGPNGSRVWWQENGQKNAINRDGSLGRRL